MTPDVDDPQSAEHGPFFCLTWGTGAGYLYRDHTEKKTAREIGKERKNMEKRVSRKCS